VTVLDDAGQKMAVPEQVIEALGHLVRCASTQFTGSLIFDLSEGLPLHVKQIQHHRIGKVPSGPALDVRGRR